MSLRVDDRSSRSRSKSPGRRRERSVSRNRAPSPPTHPAYGANTEIREPSFSTYASPTSVMTNQDGGFTMGGYTDLPPHERPGYVPQGGATPAWNYSAAPIAQTGPQNPTRNVSYTTSDTSSYQYATAPNNIKYSAKPVVSTSSQPVMTRTVSGHQQQQSSKYAPAQPPYPQAQPYFPPSPPEHQSSQHQYDSRHQSFSNPQAPPPPPPGAYPYGNVVEVVPGGGKSSSGRQHGLSVSSQRGPDLRAPSPGLTSHMGRLSVSGNRPDLQTIVPGQMPPPSPMLEAYHGTYQSISPMPFPTMLPHDDIDDLMPLDPHASNSSLNSRTRGNSSGAYYREESPPSKSKSKSSKSKSKDKDKEKSRDKDRERERDRGYEKEREYEKERRVKIYDAEQDALDLVEALSHRTPDPGPLIDILPQLSHDQMLELRNEYKRHCKVQGRGINVAKHVKMKTTGMFGKICYVTALGRWEGESYWANTWYQSSNARRELLIEALMGRSNNEIHEIKKAFKDKRYNDDLERCMEKELKADKFRKAILMALEENKQDERDVWSQELRNRDVDTLYRALKAREGGESAMLEIVVQRSDAHLRDVLRTYERKYQGNFARDALKKSNNLVGEVIAHILNGVINKPSRDAMLLHHALSDLAEPSGGPTPSSSSAGLSKAKHDRQQRVELLMSRLVRLHWDRLHFARVKDEYERKYGRVVEEDIEDSTKRGDFQEFCIELCNI